MFVGYQPPNILTLVIAYAGPSSIDTVYGWLSGIHSELGIILPKLPINDRSNIPNPSIDSIVVLGVGSIGFDNSPLGFVNDAMREATPGGHWSVIPSASDNMLQFFMLLTQAVSGSSTQSFSVAPYLQRMRAFATLRP